MTRINLVDPNILIGSHLQAEYRELPRVFTLVKKHIASGKIVSDFAIPSQYCLGPGHVTFFYDKLMYLYNRHWDLYNSMLSRGYNPNRQLFDSIMSDADTLIFEYGDWANDWKPTPPDIYLNMTRLCIRSNVPRCAIELAEFAKHYVTTGNQGKKKEWT